jgi:hypothetical protein
LEGNRASSKNNDRQKRGSHKRFSSWLPPTGNARKSERFPADAVFERPEKISTEVARWIAAGALWPLRQKAACSLAGAIGLKARRCDVDCLFEAALG